MIRNWSLILHVGSILNLYPIASERSWTAMRSFKNLLKAWRQLALRRLSLERWRRISLSLAMAPSKFFKIAQWLSEVFRQWVPNLTLCILSKSWMHFFFLNIGLLYVSFLLGHLILAQASDCIALNCSVSRNNYLNTEEFIDAVADELISRLSPKSKL